MAETHEASLIDGKRYTQVIVEDPEPLKSARLFKFVSDAVWQQRPEGWNWVDFKVHSVLAPIEALAKANEVVGAIDERLVLAGRDKDLRLSGGRDERAKISMYTLAVPEAAVLETCYLDERHKGRSTMVDGENRYVEFSNGHHDFHRELSAGFSFMPKAETLVVSYMMQRNQCEQDRPTRLRAHVWYSRFTESGYEGNTRHAVELTEEQELAVLKIFADIGGIAADSFAAD